MSLFYLYIMAIQIPITSICELKKTYCGIKVLFPTGSQTQQAGCARLQSRAFFVPEGQSGSLLTECSCGAKNPGKARHILRPPAYVRSPAAQGQGKSRPARLNPNLSQNSLLHSAPHIPMSHRNLHELRDLQTEDFHCVSVIPLFAYIAI